MAEETLQPKRLMSLDAFRGFTIIAMLMVNNPGHDSAFPDQFRHAAWGQMVTFCDMIFPWFLFMVGVALPFSASSFHKKTPGFYPYIIKAFRRMLLLIFFGVLIDSSVNKRIVVGMNVLQLIGLAYFFGAIIYETPKKYRSYIIAGLLIFYWAFIKFVPIPGEGAGFFEEEKNIIKYINTLLRPYHLAGIMSVIPTGALVLIGSYFGEMIKDGGKKPLNKFYNLLIWGAAFAVVGFLWGLNQPMSKHLWTSSYILFSAGLGCIVLGVFYFLIDIKGYQKIGFPFVIYGVNAITAYFFSIMVRVHTVQEWFVQNAAGEKITIWKAMLEFWTGLAGINLGSWLFTSTYIFFWWLILFYMYKKKWFLRV